jgi:hypothetical protein
VTPMPGNKKQQRAHGYQGSFANFNVFTAFGAGPSSSLTIYAEMLPSSILHVK